MKSHEYYMQIALNEAKKASVLDEVPIGAVIIDEQGEVIAVAGNARESTNDPSAHAEILVMREAGQKRDSWNLNGCSLYVTLEPCCMCAGAIVNARISKLVFGASDTRFGGVVTLYNIVTDPRLNHRAEIIGGIMGEECKETLSGFFKDKRQKATNKYTQ